MTTRSRMSARRPVNPARLTRALIGTAALSLLATCLGLVVAAPAQAGPLTSSPTPRVAVAPHLADPTVLGIDLVDFNGLLYAVFDTAALTDIRFSYTQGPAGWADWVGQPATDVMGWPHTDDDGPPYDYWSNFVIAVQTSDDGGGSWSELRYVILELDNAAEGNQPTITVANNAAWIAVRDAYNLVNHPDDPYGDPYRLADRLWSCGSYLATDCIESVEYRLIGNPTWTAATLTQQLDPSTLPPDITHYDGQDVDPTALEYWSTPGATHESGTDEVLVSVFFNSNGGGTPNVQGAVQPRGVEVPRAGIFQCDAQGNWDPGSGQQCFRAPRLDLTYEYRIVLRLSSLVPGVLTGRLDHLEFDLAADNADWLVGLSGTPRRSQFIQDNSQPWVAAIDDENYDLDFTVGDLGSTGVSVACEGAGLLVGNSNGNGLGFGYDNTSEEFFVQLQARTFELDGTTEWAGEFEAYLSGTLSTCAMSEVATDTANFTWFAPAHPTAQSAVSYEANVDALTLTVTSVQYPVDFSLISRVSAGAPENVTATAGDAAVTASWDAPTYPGRAAITDYRATANPGGATCLSAGSLSCTITGLTNGQAYTVTVVAINSAGDGLTSNSSAAVSPQAPGGGGTPIITFDPPGPPGAPTAVIDDTAVTLTWTAPTYTGSYPVSSYTATVSPQGLTCTTTTTTCTITGLAYDTASTAYVTASNAAGTGAASPASAPFTSTTPPAPEPIEPEPTEPVVISITGSRQAGQVRIEGSATGIDPGGALVPVLTFTGKAAQPGTRPVLVNSDGSFTWKRKTKKGLRVVFSYGDVTSNAVRFKAVPQRPPTRR